MPGVFSKIPPKWVSFCEDAREVQAMLAKRPVQLRLGLPCIGIDGGTRALHQMSFATKLEWAYDIDESLLGVLRHLHPASTKIYCGRVIGDIIKVLISVLSDVEVIMAGPP